MFEAKRAPWRRLDNAAKIFPATSGKKDTRVFRFYCELKEEIREEALQKALLQTVETYPVFLSVMRKGLFWHYLEQSGLRPVVKEESKEPCSDIYVRDKKSLLFEVTYYRKRINFEVYHALTDGTGATAFLRELVKNYLLIVHGAEGLPDISTGNLQLTVEDQENDGFEKYYAPDTRKEKTKKQKAYQIKRRRQSGHALEITEAVVSVQKTLEVARSYGVSMTVLLTAVLFCAVHEEMPKSQENRPVKFMVPVNLRKLFPSDSMLNFFGWIEPCYRFGEGKDSFEDVLAYVKQFFKDEVNPQRMAEHMSGWISLERNPFLRMAPLELKNICMLAGAGLASGELTAVFSNMSVVKMPEVYEPYIEKFGVYTSTGKLELCACSFGDKLALGFTSKCDSANILRNFFRILDGLGIESQMEAPSFPPEEKRHGAWKKVFQWFSFLCIAATVISAGINVALTPDSYWAFFVAGGVFSMWLFLAAGFVKRHNLLKDAMWELLLITAGSLLWDWGTGWKGWSVNYVFPAVSAGILLFMLGAAKIQKLTAKEYMIYLLMAGIFGTVFPFALLLADVAVVRIPSLVCVIFNFLVVTALFIFRRREVFQELHKKFHI